MANVTLKGNPIYTVVELPKGRVAWVLTSVSPAATSVTSRSPTSRAR